ncbi:hypothetical protein E1263_31385 [Kribbella antibiotica]|uniref:Uncharacterized protein n=1 Tax=Kribbella antibiotica TaxID=190195 RepID=A0A4R4Z210_9ACTN|nr:hypothetical protein E1263_31385 [Kribbella antibiotica]
MGEEAAATPTSEGGAAVEWRRVRVWFNEYAIADSTVVADVASRLEALHRQRFSRLRVTNEPALAPEP